MTSDTKTADVLRVSFKKEDKSPSSEQDCSVFYDNKYSRKAAELIRDVLNSDDSILQLSDGSILVTKTTVLTILYQWNKDKGRFYRAKSGTWQSEEDEEGYLADSEIESERETEEVN